MLSSLVRRARLGLAAHSRIANSNISPLVACSLRPKLLFSTNDRGAPHVAPHLKKQGSATTVVEVEHDKFGNVVDEFIRDNVSSASGADADAANPNVRITGKNRHGGMRAVEVDAAEKLAKKNTVELDVAKVEEVLSEMRGKDVQVYDYTGVEVDEEGRQVPAGLPAISLEASYVVVATGTSSRHLTAMGEALRRETKREGVKGVGVDGLRSKDGWVALDAGNVVIHLLTQEMRDHYALDNKFSGKEIPMLPEWYDEE